MVLVTLVQQQRQGSFQTGSHVFPLATVGRLIVTPLVDPADKIDPTKSFFIRIYRLENQIWVENGSALVGGTPAPEPDWGVLEVSATDLAGKAVRAEIDIPVRMKIGCTVELV